MTAHSDFWWNFDTGCLPLALSLCDMGCNTGFEFMAGHQGPKGDTGMVEGPEMRSPDSL